MDSLTNNVKITGGNSGRDADVDLLNGKNRLLTSSIVTVDQVLGKDNIADSWFFIGTPEDGCDGVGSATDTVRIQIVAGCDPALYPAVDVTVTVGAATLLEPNPATALADKIVSELNLDANFTGQWKASRISSDNAIVHISSRLIGEISERPDANDLQVTTTGTTFVTLGFDTLIRRSKATSLSRDPADPRIGILGISGTVNVLPGTIGSRLFQKLDNSGATQMAVNGSGTPVVFSLESDPNDDIFVNQVRIFGGGNGIKFGRFLNLNSTITNGLLVEIQSDGEAAPPIVLKSTEDLKNLFSFPSGDAFRIDVQAGGDQVIAIFQPQVPFVIRRAGTFATNDYVRITVRDNLAGVSTLESLAEGFRREP